MDNYHTSQSRSLDIRSGNGQIIEFIPIEDVAPKPQVEELGFRELWRRIMHWKWLFLGTAFGVLLLSVLITLFMSPTYRASTTLQIHPEDTRDLHLKDDQAALPLNEKDYYQTQFELLRSRNLATRVIDELGLQGKFGDKGHFQKKLYSLFSSLKQSVVGESLPEQQSSILEDNFLKNLKVQPVENSQIFKISFDDIDPVDSAKIANALAQNYITMNFDRRADAVSYAKTYLSEELAKGKRNLEDSENRLVAYAKKQGIVTTDDKQSLTSQSIVEINRAFAEAQAERITAEAAYRQSQNVAGADRVLENPAVQRLKEQLANLQSDYQEKSQLFKPSYPEMQQLSSQINALRSDIAHESASIDTTTRGSLKAKFDAAKQKEDNLRSELQKQKGTLMDQRDKSVEYNTLEREVEANRQNYESLLERLKEVNIAEGSGVNNVLIVDKASVPTRPNSPNVLFNLSIGAISGLLLGLLAALLADMLDDRLRSVEDIKRTLSSVHLIGVIPFLSGKHNKNILAGSTDKTNAFMLEAFRSLRENVLMFKSAQEGQASVINITSPSPSEGKTTISVNLATVFAYTSKKVLLVDCDMRKPETHNKLHLENKLGLSDYLRKDCGLADVVQESPVENLFVISAGAAVPNPTELLAGDSFTAFLEDAAGKFDMIILDSPPVMGMADALIISNRSGNTLLVSAYGQTSKRNLKDAYERLGQSRSNIIGMVLTKMKAPDVAKKYYGYPNRHSTSTAIVAQ
jgi:capsular exopolysaccharide synthesis family protein